MSEVPLTTILSNDEAVPGSVGSAQPNLFLPPDVNFVTDSATKRRVETEVIPLVMTTRLNRSTQELAWLDLYRMYSLSHDTHQKYRGRSNAYLPIWARIEHTHVAALSRGLFPSDEYLDVTDGQSEDPKNTAPVKRYLQWEFDERGKLRSNIKTMLAPVYRFGTSPMKVDYRKPLTQQKRGGIIKLDQTMRNGMVPDSTRQGLHLSTRPLFSWYIYPSHAQTLEEATLIFEDIDIPRSKVIELATKNYWEVGTIEQVMEAYNTAVNKYVRNIPLGATALSDQITSQASSSPQGQLATVTEVWTELQLPASGYADGEDKDFPVPVRITLAGELVLEIRRNPYWHQRPPYVVGRYDIEAGSFYGGGLARLLTSIQYLCNDFANQTNDVGSYVLNPAWKVIRGLMAGAMQPIKPGRIWPVSDKDAITPVEMDVGLIGGGQSMLNMFLQMAQDWSGAPALAMGIGGSKSGKTATQSQIMQNNLGMANQDLVEDLERDCLIPLMYMTWVNGQQFLPDEVMMAVAGANIRLTRAELAVNPRFRWLASSQMMNRAQRVQQTLQLLQAVAPLIPYINQTGYVVDVASLVERVWNDGLGLRGFDRFIRAMSPQEKMMQQFAMMQSMGGRGPAGPLQTGGQQEDRVRSALEQTVGGGEDMAQGEGEDFAQVRNGADAMAAQAGAQR